MVSVLVGNGMGMIWHDEELHGQNQLLQQSLTFSRDWMKQQLLSVSISVVGHLLFLLTFLVYVPQSKHFHLITGPANAYFNRTDNGKT